MQGKTRWKRKSTESSFNLRPRWSVGLAYPAICLYLSRRIDSLAHPYKLVRLQAHQATNKTTKRSVLTELIWPLLWVQETYMGAYMSLFSGISPHRLAVRAAYTAQVSVAKLGQLPHLVPHSLALADLAGRALTKSHNSWVGTSRGRPEATPILSKNGFGFASPFFPSLVLSFIPLLPLYSNKRWRMITLNLLRKHRSSLFYDGCE